ncbi:MAG: Calx-beta domain-containing protein [Pseudomonadales bacterium]
MSSPKAGFAWAAMTAVCASLSACGGGSGGSTSAAAQPASASASGQSGYSLFALAALESDPSAKLTISLAEPAVNAESFVVSTADNTANAGRDYQAFTETVIIAAGSKSVQVAVPVLDDGLDEADEALQLSVTSEGGLAGPSGTSVVILDDEPLPRLSVGDIIIPEGDASTQIARVPVTLSAISERAISFSYGASSVSAEADVDFVQVSGSYTFAPGERETFIDIELFGDLDVEPDEQLQVRIASVEHAALLDGIGVVTIENDDARLSSATLVRVSSDNLVEGSSGLVRLSLSETANEDVVVDLVDIPGDASVSQDYSDVSKRVTISAGQSSTNFSLQTVNDELFETGEAMFLTITNLSGPAQIEVASVDIAIADNEAPPQLSLADAAVNESTGAQAAVVASLDVGSATDVRFTYASQAGSATDEIDFQPISGSAVIPAGSRELALPLLIIADDVDEPDETFSVRITSIDGAEMGREQATVTIAGTAALEDDDPQPTVPNPPGASEPAPALLPELYIVDASVTEGDSGSRGMVFELQLSEPTSETVTVGFATSAGTATVGTDFSSASGSVSFAPGSVRETIVISVLGDVESEPVETLQVQLETVSQATLVRTEATGTIIDNDGEPVFSVANTSATEANSGTTNLNFVVSLSSAAAANVSVGYRTESDSATSGVDYLATSGTLDFAPGQTSRTVNVQLVGDTIDEFDERLQLRLSEASGAAIARDVAIGTVTDNDAPPSIAVADRTVSESASSVALTVSLSTASGKSTSVNYATQNLSATGGADFNAASGTLTFAPGQISKVVSVGLIDDSISESSESFRVTLSNPVNLTIADGTASVQITDDDEASASVRLTWSAPATNADGTLLQDLAGYRVYQGRDSGTLAAVSTVPATGNGPQSTTVYNVSPDNRCFAVTAFDDAGNESTLTPTECWSF